MHCFDDIKRLKSTDVCRNIPLVAVSGLTDRMLIIKAIEAGAVEYIAKPFNYNTVYNKFCHILGIPYDISPGLFVEEDIVTFSFLEMFNREIKAASRGNHSISIMLAAVAHDGNSDIRHGDVNNLAELTIRVIKTKLRDTDTIFHHRSGIIAILLPFTAKCDVAVVERKLHDAFNTHSLIKPRNRRFKLITASVTFPDDGRVGDRLLEELEDALEDNIKALDE
jgi:CheY-like chemotaxis protein